MPNHSSGPQPAGEIRAQHHALPPEAEQYLAYNTRTALRNTHTEQTGRVAMGVAHCWAVWLLLLGVLRQQFYRFYMTIIFRDV